MSLKRVITSAVALLGLLALTAASALILLTTYLHRTSAGMEDAVMGVRTAQELEVEVLTLHRLSNPFLRDTEGSLRLLEATQARLRDHMDVAVRSAQTADERALLGKASDALAAYLRTWQEAIRAPAGSRTLELNVRLEATLVPLGQLVAFNVGEAHDAQAQADRWDGIANVVGVGVAVLLMLGGAALLLWMRLSVFRPLLDIVRAMRHFGSGRKDSRAPQGGPAELREMANTFNEMADSLARQQEQQLTFVAGVAHDLRNPLSALKMSMALVTSGRTVTEERLQKTLGMVRRQVSRLDRMVGDLLDSTRLEAGRFELSLEPRDARELASSVVELYQSGGDSHALVLQLPETPVMLRCDVTRVEQVLHNLVSNALKYSPDDSPVEVSVRLEGQEGVLSVTDQGIGISPEDLDHLFKPFGRTGQARKTAPGVGLGLSVARRIVEAHGGRIEVESHPGEGSTFRVRLPLFHAASQRSGDGSGNAGPAPPEVLH